MLRKSALLYVVMEELYECLYGHLILGFSVLANLSDV